MAETPEQKLKRLQLEAKNAKALADYLGKINDKLSQHEAVQQRIIQLEIEHKIAIEEKKKALASGVDQQIQAALQEEERARKAKEEFREQTEAIENQTKASKELEKALDSSRQAAEDLGKSIANVFAGENAIQFENIISDIGSGLGKLSNIVKEGQFDVLGFFSGLSSAALVNFATQLFKTSVQLADLEDNFRRATGASAGMARSVTNVYEETRKLGFSMQEASKASESLYNNFTDFTMVSKSTRESLAETSVVLSRMGISHDTFSKSVQLSTKALGMSAAQAGQTMLDLEGFAESLGVAPSKMAEDFIGARNAVAKLGQDGTQAFKDLAIAAKVTGMSIDSILRLTDAFDTFDGAAAQAGKLNAAIGGNFVNAMELMMATDPAERFNMIRDSLLDTGLSFDEMSYYQKNFFKESLGLSDVGELAALMSGEMDLVAGATDQSSQSLIEAKKKAAELATAQESLNAVLVQITPVIVELVDGIQSLTTYMAENAEGIARKIRLVLGLMVAIKAVTIVMGVLSFVAKGMSFVFGFELPAALNRTNKELVKNKIATQGAGTAAKVSAKQIMALGIAVLAMGVGLGAAAAGMGYFVASFKDLGDAAWPAVAGIVAFTVVFGALMALLIGLIAGPQAALTAAGVGVILAVGGAILMMGGAIALASIGLSHLITSLGQLGSLSASLLLIPVILYGVAGALSMMINPITLTGIITMTALFTAMGFAAKNMGIETAESFKVIADAINSVPTTRNIAFTRSMNSASRAFSSARTAAPAVSTAPSSYQVTINVMLDRERLATVVREITAQDALNQAAGRGTA